MGYKRYFGEVYGNPEGQRYTEREDVRVAGLHAHKQAGISGTARQGADAIVLSGGYEDDEDYGDVVIYTGHGGQNNGKQIAHQTLEDPGNAGLVTSEREGLPVRVIRGPVKRSEYAPKNGYQYGGIYRVVWHWLKRRDDGYLVCQFLMVKIDSMFDSFDVKAMFSDKISNSEVETLTSGPPAERVPTAVNKIRRRAGVRENIKRWHSNLCQACGQALNLPLGRISETAHIRPLGSPHNGPDEESNALCLCPNDHVRFDHGGLYIEDDFEVIDGITDRPISTLRTHPRHMINIDHIRYHRYHWTPRPMRP